MQAHLLDMAKAIAAYHDSTLKPAHLSFREMCRELFRSLLSGTSEEEPLEVKIELVPVNEDLPSLLPHPLIDSMFFENNTVYFTEEDYGAPRELESYPDFELIQIVKYFIHE